MFARIVALIAVAGVAACKGSANERGDVAAQAPTRNETPEDPPVMINKEPPFRYPAALYAQKVQGNVTLRLFVDSNGSARPESTRVELSSGTLPLDSAAIKGSRELRFIPAKLHGVAIGVTVLFPVYFRHPEGSPLPGDSILGRLPPSASRPPRR
jgi:TonB family protein